MNKTSMVAIGRTGGGGNRPGPRPWARLGRPVFGVPVLAGPVIASRAIGTADAGTMRAPALGTPGVLPLGSRVVRS